MGGYCILSYCIFYYGIIFYFQYMERCYIAMMRRLNHHRAEMKKKILEEQMIDNHKPAKPQNMVYQKFSIFDQIFLISG